MYNNLKYFIKKLKSNLIKKGQGQKAFYLLLKTFFFIKKNLKKNPISLLISALLNLDSIFFIKKIYKAGRTVFIPFLIKNPKKINLSLKWLFFGAKNRGQQIPFFQKLAFEIFDTALYKSESIKKKKDIYKLVIQNRTNVRFY